MTAAAHLVLWMALSDVCLPRCAIHRTSKQSTSVSREEWLLQNHPWQVDVDHVSCSRAAGGNVQIETASTTYSSVCSCRRMVMLAC